jgi:predicted TIM-barrel fold metal-dependent hydrolase
MNLHVGSSGAVHHSSKASPYEVSVALFPLNGIETIVDWIYARIPARFPNLKIALSEAGVSWVPMAIERLRRVYRQREASVVWLETDGDPVDILHRNFWFTSIENPSAFRLLDLIGEDRVMAEIDYPHGDTTWPDSQALIRSEMEHLAPEVVRKICYENAAELHQHPEPPPDMVAASVIGRTQD